MTLFFQISLEAIEVTAPASQITTELIRTTWTRQCHKKNLVIIPALNPDTQTYGFAFIYNLPGMDAWSPTYDMFCTYDLNATQTEQVKNMYPSHFDDITLKETTEEQTPDEIMQLIASIECEQEIKAALGAALTTFSKHVTINPELAKILKELPNYMHPISKELVVQLNRAFKAQTIITNLHINLHYPWEILYLNHILPHTPHLTNLFILCIDNFIRNQGANQSFIDLIATLSKLKNLRGFDFIYGYPHRHNPDFFSHLIEDKGNDGALITFIKSAPQLRNLAIMGSYTEQNLRKLLTTIATNSKIDTLPRKLTRQHDLISKKQLLMKIKHHF